MKLIPTDKSKDTAKKYEEIWSKVKFLIKSRNKKSDDIMMKNIWKSNSIQIMIYLWRKILELHDITVAVRSIFKIYFLRYTFVKINWERYKCCSMIELLSLKA